MTQAFNLAQLANNLNTSGQLDATDGLTGLVATANLASGSASSSTYLRGDQTWATVTQKVLQVVNGSQGTSNASTSSSSWSDVLTTTITPSSSTSKILVLANAWSGCTRNGDQLYVAGRIVRRVGGTDTVITIGNDMMGDEWTNHYRYTPSIATSVITYRMVFNQLDSPATTSAVTYVYQHAALGSVATNQTSGTEVQLMEISA